MIPIKSLEDSVSLNLRKRDYVSVSDLCYELLTDHIDSLKDAGIISKLYLAELRLDSSGDRMTNLKSFLEILILNNPDKESFVKQSFYIIQKCKVSLEMYESAMAGFQEIINQNPYSYEGLVASWDYAATSLLSGGQGGGERNLEFGMSDLEFENSYLGIGDKSVDNISQIPNSKSSMMILMINTTRRSLRKKTGKQLKKTLLIPFKLQERKKLKK